MKQQWLFVGIVIKGLFGAQSCLLAAGCAPQLPGR